MLISLMTKAGWQRAFSLNLGSKQRNRRHKTGHFPVQEPARVQTLYRSDMYVVVISCFHSTLRLKTYVEGAYMLNLLLPRFIDNREK